MNNPLSTVLRLFAALSALAFVVVTPLGLAGFNLDRNLFNPELYKRSLVEQGMYPRFPALMAEQIVVQIQYARDQAAADPSLRPPPPHLETLGLADYEAVLTDIVTPEYAQAQVESVIDQEFLYWNSNAESIPVRISIAEVKARFTGEVAVRTINRVLATWPECNLIELVGWGGIVTGAKLEDLPVCRPPDAITQAVLPVITDLLSEAVLTQIINVATNVAVSQAPDEVVIFHLPPTPEEIKPDRPPIPRAQVNLFRWASRLSLLLALGLLAGTVLLGARSVKGFLLWSGVPLLLAGLAGLLIVAVAYSSLNQIVETVVLNAMDPPVSEGLAAVALRVGTDVAQPVVTWSGIEAGVLVGFGLLLTLAGVVASLLSRNR